MMLILRFTHVVFGALWVGMMTLQVCFLFPSLMEAGPDAGKVMQGMMRRRLPLIMSVIALLALISGTWLLMKLMGGNAAVVMRTPMGRAYAWGGTAAIVAFLLGFGVMRPMMMKSMRLAETLGPGGAPEVQRLRARGAMIGRVVTVLLLIALALMAVARYL